MSKQLTTRIPDEWVTMIEAAAVEAGFEIKASRGKAGGVSLWIRGLIAESIGQEVVDLHAQQSKAYADERKKSPSVEEQG